MIEYICVIVVSYLFGSIPTGLIFAKILAKKDITKQGSGNIGATNAFRVGGKMLGILTLFGDMLKCVVPILLIRMYGQRGGIEVQDYILLSGVSCILGHIFPVWLKFKGGRGVATSVAFILLVAPILSAIGMGTILVVLFLSRIMSVASIGGFMVMSIIAFLLYDIKLASTVLLISILVFYRHKDNIKRLINGKEKRIF